MYLYASSLLDNKTLFDKKKNNVKTSVDRTLYPALIQRKAKKP